MELSTGYLAVRAEDHVVLGVQWYGATVDAGTAQLRVDPGGGGLLITFPPQHMGEGAFAPDLFLSLGSGQLAGLSQVAVDLDAGTVVALDVAGLLTALSAGRLRGRLFDDGTTATAIEMPYGLLSSPSSGSGGAVSLVHSDQPVVSPTNVTGSWHTRLRDSSGDLRFAGTRNIDRNPNEPSSITLDPGQRTLIVDNSGARPAPVSRFELAPLGGSLSVMGSWDDLDWSNETALGRDQHVKLVLRGILYPFGHRAVYIEATDREFSEVDGTAALRKRRSLIVTEPSRSMVVEDASLNRMFPFDDVEITTQVFSGLGEPLERTYTRPTPDTSELDGAKQLKRDRINELTGTLTDEINRTWQPSDLGGPEADEYLQLEAETEPLEELLGRMQSDFENAGAISDEIGRLSNQIDAILNGPVGPDGMHSPEELQRVDELSASIGELQQRLAGIPSAAQIQSLVDQLTPKQARLRQLLDAITPSLQPPHSIAAIAAHGNEAASEIVNLEFEITGIQEQIDAALALVTPRPWIHGPTRLTGQPLAFPVRCSTRTSAQPDVHLQVPLVFVAEFHLQEEFGMPAFNSLTDGDSEGTIQDILDRFFAARSGATEGAGPEAAGPEGVPNLMGAVLDVRGTVVDVIHANAPAPGDLVEVHAMTLVGVPHAGSFAPAITQFRAALPAVRGLLGEAQAAVRPIAYRPEFLAGGEAEKIPLAFVGDKLGIDFRAQADKSGGLLAPVLDATGISRLDGPVSIAGLLPKPDGFLDPSKLLGEGASLLGFKLTELLGDIDVGPKIVQHVLDGGAPSVSVEWSGIKLKSNPIFEAELGDVEATFTLTVDASVEGATTTCVVNNFALCFPTRDDPLLKVQFTSVTYLQAPGHEPDLSLKVAGVDFLGDLELLEELQKKVDLGSNAPKIKLSTSGIGVSYTLEVPNADCGQFSLRNIAVRAGLDVPFQPTDELPITLSLGFASRAKPFNLSVMALGGGGYIDLRLDRSGIRSMEFSLEFGATLALDFGIVSAEAHVLGGARIEIGPGTKMAITGYIRIGGSVELLGLITVSIELVVSLRYDKDDEALIGRATLVIEVDLTLYSDSIELDSGEWKLQGGGISIDEAVTFGSLAAGPEGADDGLGMWQQYREAFAQEVPA